MAVGDVYEMAVRGEYEGQLVVNVTHYRMKSARALADQWADMLGAWSFSFRDFLNAGYRMDTARFRALIPFGLQMELAFPANTTGLQAGTGLAAPNALLITWFTAVGGRSRRGRMFFPPPVMTSTSGSNITGTYKAFVEGKMTTWVNAFKGGGTDPNNEQGVWSRKIAGVAPPFAVGAFQPITGYAVGSVLAVQRRRRIGTGR